MRHHPKEITDAFMDGDSMLEVTLRSGAKAMVSNLVVGNKGASRVIWIGDKTPSEEDIKEITQLVQEIVMQCGGRARTPERFHTMKELEHLTSKYLGGGKG